MSNINVLDEEILNITEDSTITFNNESNIIIKSNSNMCITANAKVNIVLLANKIIDIELILNRFAEVEITLISFNNKEINFNANLLEGSSLTSNFLLITKSVVSNINQNVKHIGRDSYSMINNKAISFSKSTINFNTVGIIKNGIKNCNCNQLTRGLILESDSTIKATPILLIDEYDVKAYHGATIGNVNDDDLFYLMSRGLSRKEAFNLIVNGLFKPYFEKVFIEKEKEKIIKNYQTFFK